MPFILPAVKALIEKQGKYLLFEQMVGNISVYDIPGGKMKFGEGPYDSLHRELLEETNSQIEIRKFLGVYWFYRKDNGEQIICLTFLCKLLGDKVDFSRNSSSTEKISKQLWVNKQELRLRMAEPGFSSLVDELP